MVNLSEETYEYLLKAMQLLKPYWEKLEVSVDEEFAVDESLVCLSLLYEDDEWREDYMARNQLSRLKGLSSEQRRKIIEEMRGKFASKGT